MTTCPKAGACSSSTSSSSLPFYSTDVPDWGTAYAWSLKLGEQAQVLVDLGHHAQGVNIEQIVAFLLDEGKLGGFHFNNRKYADDDLIVGSVNPYELFLIYNELVTAEQSDEAHLAATANNVAYMIDQCHNVEGKVAPMILSVLNCQEAYAKAQLVRRATLKKRGMPATSSRRTTSSTQPTRRTCARLGAGARGDGRPRRPARHIQGQRLRGEDPRRARRPCVQRRLPVEGAPAKEGNR